jgi:hypothetical protein
MTHKQGSEELTSLRKTRPSVASRVLARKNHLALAIFFHLFQLVLDDDDGLINQMQEVWVVSVKQLKLDVNMETLEKHGLLLLIYVDIVGGIPQSLNELGTHSLSYSLVQVIKFLLLELQSAMGYIVSSEMSLELILVDRLSRCCDRSPTSLRRFQMAGVPQNYLLTVGALGYLQLLLNRL